MKLIASLAFLLTLTLTGRPAEDMVTGPPVGTKLGSVKCYANSSPYAGKEEFDAAKEIGSRPGAFLFIHVLNRNTAPVIRGVNNLYTELGFFGFKGFIVMLNGDRTSAEEMMKRVNGSLKMRHPIVLSLDGIEGPGDLALNRRCTLSLVVVNKGKITKTIAFTDTGMHSLKPIRAAFEAAVGEIPTAPKDLLAIAQTGLPKDEKTLRTLAARQALDLYRANRKATEEYANGARYAQNNRKMRRPQPQQRNMQRGESPPVRGKARPAAAKPDEKKPAVQRRGAPPKDPELNSLLRSYIRKTNEDAQVDEIFADIQKRAKGNKDLGQQTVAMFQLMLSYPDRYGSKHAQELARRFLSDRGVK